MTSRRELFLCLAVSLLLGAMSFGLFTWKNQFPWYYHPDEPGKVEQAIGGEWNYHHPLLLLATTRALLPGTDKQAVVERGRAISAGFAAASVTFLCALAWLVAGRTAGMATGLLLATHHQLFELGHYMKEDPAMLAGVALVFLVLHLYERYPTGLGALALGAACGIAASGKYAGALLLVPALIVIWTSRRDGVGARIALLFAGATVIFLAINFPMLLNSARFGESFGREMEYVVEGQKGITKSVPHSEYISAFRDNTTPALWVLIGAAVAFQLGYLKRKDGAPRLLSSPAGWATLLFPFAYMVLLSFSPKANDRYFLPCTAMFVFAGAIALPSFAKRVGIHPALLLVAAVAANIFSLPTPLHWPVLADYIRAFQTDDRADARKWVVENLPVTAVIFQDNRVGLPRTDADADLAERQSPIPQTVYKLRPKETDSLNDLRKQGVQYVALSESDYGRYFREGLKPKETAEESFSRARGLYEEIRRDGKRIWERERGTVIYLHPGIEIYEVTPAQTAPPVSGESTLPPGKSPTPQ